MATPFSPSGVEGHALLRSRDFRSGPGLSSAPVTDAPSWKASATYIASFARELEARGELELVRARLEPMMVELVKTPHAQSWWPGRHLIALLEATEAVGGPASVRQIGVRVSHRSMGPLVRPLASVVLSLTKEPMVALLSRLSTFAAAGVRGIDCGFVRAGDATRGVVTFTFPQPVPPVMSAVWHGLFDVGFTLAKTGRVASEQVEPTVHRFEVVW